MKIRIITLDEKLEAALRNASFVDALTKYEDTRGLKNIVEDILIAEASIISLGELDSLYNKSLPKLYLVKDAAAISKENKIENLHVIEIGEDAEKTKNIIEEYINEDLIKFGNVITFRGSAAQVGTTMITEGIAKIINESTDHTVALLSFTIEKGLEYNSVENIMSLESIINRAESNILDAKSIIKELKTEKEETSSENETKNIYYMSGFTEPKDYDAANIRKIISIAAEAFDIVIVDLGGYPTRMMLPIIKKAKSNYMIITPNTKVLSRYKENNVEKIIGEQVERKVICNKVGLYNGFQKNYLKSSFPFDIISMLPNSEYAYDAELENKTLYDYKEDNSYVKAFIQLAKVIAYENNIQLGNIR